MDLPSISAESLGLDIPDEFFAHQGVRLVDISTLLAAQIDRFSFPTDLFDDLIFLQPNNKMIRAASRPLDIPRSPLLDRIGIDFIHIDMKVPRLTTSAAMTWGRFARANIVDTTAEQCDHFLIRQPIQLNSEQLDVCTGRGPVLIRFRSHSLGLGFLESVEPDRPFLGRVRSLYPSAFARDVQQTSAMGNPQ